ncbi:hypothetical protein ERO13_A06G139300v2 [Gossypium hirsutum]|uniref:Uncharacterized protein n=4 Tax=Gossypium TaxID=3633 RepID=A0A5J5VET0_GOSBA|nr:hypothetical protein ES319_A06G150300v1 [Gossypium barbadense]KAG4195922.1 hypothetical protein ERO13_A06G139300v2 [Gossypium hirsutum]TYH13835.1 hypothetical protein ES288_A06G171100v1 [Gossypium darwinii]TYI23426.1 hypothetical protein ES332_A06G164300v1 [Gossypium tomentosum]TYJ30747.1 hypothetical protein E1A91_A06G151000v1 [Gossypium mustelinum]
MKGVKYLESSCEKAPALFISHNKPSTSPSLETIFEETSQFKFEVEQHNTLFFLLFPFSLSFLSYLLLYTHFA